ncbi:MAG: hypothetical protein UHM08_02280 [Bacteroidales bacterium]|nr:hypothetical protein [Bacteroidales bacterium]
MSRTVCPWCKAPLVLKDDIFVCGNTDCPACDEKYLHEELIRTRKALDVAVKRLGYIKDNYKNWTPDRDEQMIAQAVNGLDEIKTALEQEDVK